MDDVTKLMTEANEELNTLEAEKDKDSHGNVSQSSKRMSISRRGFLYTACIAVGAIAVGEGMNFASAGADELLRPPTSLGSNAFSASCVKCYRCIEVCPTNVVEPATLADGITAWRTPKLNFHKGYCNFCNKCVDVCPTGALSAQDLSSLDMHKIGVAYIRPDVCLAYVEGCEICKDKCPYSAITVSDTGKPQINEELCVGCGICVYECPALIYRSYSGGKFRGVEVASTVDQAHNAAAALNNAEGRS